MSNYGRIKEISKDMKIRLIGDLNMRLYNIYYTCKVALNCLNQIEVKAYTDKVRQLKGWNISKKALDALLTIDFIKDDVKNLYNTLNPIDREKTILDIGPVTYIKFMPLYEKLASKLESVVDLYESMKEGVSQPGIDIKIPSCNSLKEYTKILDDIDFIFTKCPYLINENEEIKYTGTDVGSDWITFAIITSTVTTSGFIILNNLAAIINKATALLSNKKILDIQNEALETMRMKNETTQEVLDIFKKMKEITYKKHVDELQEELGKLENGEEEGKVSKSLEKLANLLDKGVEIYTSIETPKDIKVLFPHSETQQSLSDNLLKYIEDKTVSK